MSVINYIYLKETQAAWVQRICLYYFTFIILQLAFKFATEAALVFKMQVARCSTTECFEIHC